MSRSAALPMVTFEAERLAITVAPASAAKVEGGRGDQTSSQISTARVKPGMSAASNDRSVPKATTSPASVISSTVASGAMAN